MKGTIVSRGCVVALCAAALLSVSPAAALAAGSTTKTKPAKASPSVYLSNLFSVGGGLVTIPGRETVVTAVVRPFVPGQWARISAFVNGHLFKTVRLRLKPSKRRTYGGFVYGIHAPAVGNIQIKVEHARNTKLLGFATRRQYTALDTNIGFGASGRFVQLVQQRLSALHFFIPQTGVYDQGTGLAIDAYHRLLHWGTSETIDGATISELLNGRGAFPVRFPKQGSHAEGNLSMQLLALINGSKVYWIFPISSGKPSTPTILGSFQVYRRTPGYLPDGMYYSSFFTGGYAIHGYNPAPDYPASHGCMRLPIVDAIPAFNWLNYGDWVDTYY